LKRLIDSVALLTYLLYLMFNSAGYVVNKTCSSLDPHTVNMLVCPRDWCGWHWTCNTCNCEL